MRPRPTEEDPFKIKAVIQQTEGAVVVLDCSPAVLLAFIIKL